MDDTKKITSEEAARQSALLPARMLLVVPLHNCREWIGQCLDSLRDQTFTGWTALVADDASTDDTVEAVAPYLDDPRISYRRLDQRGWLMGNTLDALRTLDPQQGDVVAILDGDDYIYPTCLEKIWLEHRRGFDLVYTDEDIQGQAHSVGRALVSNIPARKQLWSMSQLRSFKGYLFKLLDDAWLRDEGGGYFRAAGDLSLYLPMAELAGQDKVRFIDERLYFYRVHEQCNFKVKRPEQLGNNAYIRSRPVLPPQVDYFDFTEVVEEVDKAGLFEFARDVRARYPLPRTVCLRHRIWEEEWDSWRSYHDLWIERGVYLRSEFRGTPKGIAVRLSCQA